jgi:hypothetical protein
VSAFESLCSDSIVSPQVSLLWEANDGSMLVVTFNSTLVLRVLKLSNLNDALRLTRTETPSP